MIGLGLGLWQNTAAISGGGGGGAVAATWTPTNGTSKHSAVTLSNGNLTATPATAGFFESVRATRASTGAFSFTATFGTTNAPGLCFVGIDDGTTDLSVNDAIPGSSNSLGVVLQIFSGNWYISRNGGNVQGPISSPAVVGSATPQTVLITCDKGAGTVAFSTGGTQIGTTETGVGFTNWYAVTGGKGGDGVVVADFTSY